MRRNMKFLFVALVLAKCSFGVYVAYASTPSFKQTILPLNCQYEVINDGHGTIRYLTPKECNQILPPYDKDHHPSNGSNRPIVSSSLTPDTTAILPSPLVLTPSSLNKDAQTKLYETRWQPVLSSARSAPETTTTVNATKDSAQDTAVAVAALGGGFVLLVVFILFII